MRFTKMGLDLEQKSKSENNHDPAFSGQKVLEPGTNDVNDACDPEMSPIVKYPLSNGNEDVEVNITGCTNAGKALVVEDSCEDATECSSSFADTGSGTENASFSDTEVESQIRADNGSSSMHGDYCGPPRRRKKRTTTTHWRRFIGPLMQRCKWVELKLKQLRSEERKYDKELAAYNHTKELDFAHLTLDGFDIKSVPISGRVHRNKVMKRNKRKRVEEECDIASYMSNHTLFSYFEKTDHTSDAWMKDFHGVAIGGNDENIHQEFKLSDIWSSRDYEINDISLDHIIQKIEVVQSQVHELKTRIGNVVSENQGRFHSVTHSTMLGSPDILNHSDLNCDSWTGSQLQSEYHNGELLMDGNASSSGYMQDYAIKNGVLVHNHSIKKEVYDFENVMNHLAHKTNASFVENKSISQVQVSEYDLANINAVHNVHSSLKSCSRMKSNVPRAKSKGRKLA
ncbi:unnamed protein product [Lupinus luteus]|uniref:Uncharacterized protein n=1 Tax=Lupinus luteus TaxID=3873 RepID=A0AAV1XSN3_LUPLU